jgi:hypothetical protein
VAYLPDLTTGIDNSGLTIALLAMRYPSFLFNARTLLLTVLLYSLYSLPLLPLSGGEYRIRTDDPLLAKQVL